MTRLRTSFALAVLVALATALAACGGSDRGDEDPRSVIDDATLQGIESGDLDLSLEARAPGSGGGDLAVSLAGPFQGGGQGELPQLDLDASVRGEVSGDRIRFDGGLVLLPNTAYVNYQGVEYEVDPTTFSFIESVIERPKSGGDGSPSGGASACQERVAEVRVAQFIDNLRNEGSADVGGTETTKVSGDLDPGRALDELLAIAEDPTCEGPLAAAGPLPPRAAIEAAKDEVEGALKTAHVDVYVGDDDIVRRISAQLSIEPTDSSKSGPRRLDLEFDLELSGVNEEQEISAPDGAKPLTDLFIKLGINPLELLSLLQGEESEALGNLLESLGETSIEPGGGDGGDGRPAYLRCLGEAKTAVDLQNCARLLG